MMRVILAILWLASVVCVGACSDRGAGSAPAGSGSSTAPSGDRASVAGTVLDASSGEPVAGARVRAPSGAEATTDAQGRFLIEGLEPGLSGELKARSEDGREASSPLRPLRAGRLEVVLHLH